MQMFLPARGARKGSGERGDPKEPAVRGLAPRAALGSFFLSKPSIIV